MLNDYRRHPANRVFRVTRSIFDLCTCKCLFDQSDVDILEIFDRGIMDDWRRIGAGKRQRDQNQSEGTARAKRDRGHGLEPAAARTMQMPDRPFPSLEPDFSRRFYSAPNRRPRT